MKKIIFYLFNNMPKLTSFVCLIITFLFIKKITNSNSSKFNFLVLNKERFNKDLDILMEDNDFNFYVINQNFLYYLQAPFVFFIKESLNKNKWWEIQDSILYKKFIKNGTIFMENYINFLTKVIKINFIITPSYYYFQDRIIENACSSTSVKYIVINKENILDVSTLPNKILNNLKKNISFKGHYIITQNDYENKCLVDSKIASAEKIFTLGSPRFDKLYNYANKNQQSKKNINNEINITLFSFRHSIGGYKLADTLNTSGFSKISNDGAQNYFINVHSAIMEAAYLNKNCKFYIKTKFSSGWIDRINKIKESFINLYEYDFNNVIVTSDIPAQELIKKSKLVIGINSSALVEAKVFKLNVLVPIFDELMNSMSQYIYFTKYFGKDFIVADSKNELIKSINHFINNHSINRSPNRQLLNETFSLDVNGYTRYNKFFKSLDNNE